MPTLIGEKRTGNITTRVGKNGILLREQQHYYTVQGDSKYQDRAEIVFDTLNIVLAEVSTCLYFDENDIV